MSNFCGQLTRHPEGSMKELWAVSFPLLLSILSSNVMSFFDRLILSKYDIEAMNAAVVAGLIASVFQYGAMGIASISEVFVGQFNGAQKHQKIGEPIWQMIWFSLMTAIIFIPLGIFSGPFFISNPDYMQEGIPYFKWMMFFGPVFPITTALASFFVGRGQVKLIMVSSILTNILNIILDFVLIFGVKDILPALGAEGAAMATVMAEIMQAIILFIIFLKPQHKALLGTGQWHFKPRLFWKSMKTGLPNSISGVVEMSAWSMMAQVLANVSEAHITVFSIGNSFFCLFAFGFLGVQQGITTVASNYLGANREALLSQSLRSGVKIIFVMMLLLLLPLCVFPEFLANQFLNEEASAFQNEELRVYLMIAMRWLWLYFFLDATSWLISGVLTAAGDTRFVMMMNGISAWFFCVLPTYIYVVHFNGSPVASWALCAVYAILNTSSFYLRYKSKSFRKERPLHVLLDNRLIQRL